MMCHRFAFVISTLGLLVSCSPVAAGEWGDLKGQFLYDGVAPEPAKLAITRDIEVCSKHPLVDESLVVGKNRGVANIVVYLLTRNPPIHPDIAGKIPKIVKMDNKRCRFDPHILPFWRGKQKLKIGNLDSVGHNSNLQPFGEAGINTLIAPGKSIPYAFTRPQRIPSPVSCNLHPWMKGYVLPRDNPYFAVSKADGRFRISNLPAGELEFQAWQEKAGYVSVGNWTRGRFRLEIKPGKVSNLGTIKLPPTLFDKK